MEKKNIKDYLHLYKDVIVQVRRKNDKKVLTGRVCEITSRSNHGDWVEVWFDGVETVTSMTWETSSSNCHHFFFEEDYIKPFLRPLSSMTEEESETYNRINETLYNMADMQNQVIQSSEATRYLLSKHFDLFGLIEAGLALTPQPNKI